MLLGSEVLECGVELGFRLLRIALGVGCGLLRRFEEGGEALVIVYERA